jgi:hypothetical protein
MIIKGAAPGLVRNLRLLVPALLLASAVILAADGDVHAENAPAAKAAKHGKPSGRAPARAVEAVLEPKAIELLKAASSRLAAAHSLQFTAVIAYENPSLLGPPLVYTTKSDVVVERPDKLRVITPFDGPPTEFYYDGKTMAAFAPTENLVAVAEAPSTIDAALQKAYDSAAIYFPFSDVIVADPYGDIAKGLKVAFYIGQSQVVGGVTTDMLAYASDDVFVQIWIGADDKLPRMLRAVYRNDPLRLRHTMELRDWQLDVPVPADSFASPRAAAATKIQFARPDPPAAQPKPAAKGKKPAKSE